MQVETGNGRRCADDAGSGLNVLLADGIGDVACGKTAFGGLLRVDPDAHRIIAAAEYLHLTDARDTGDTVLDVQNRIVAQIVHVIPAIGRDDMDDERQVGRALGGRDAKRAHLFRQARFSLRNTVLHQLLGLIGIGAEREGDRQRHDAIGGRLALHVEHALDAVDLFFKRRGDGFGNDGRVGARILRANHDLRRHDFRIFRDRQTCHADQTGNEDQDRQNASEDRPVDEKA